MGLDISRVELDENDLQGFGDAIRAYQREMHKSMQESLRRCTIDLLKSIRARTIQSKKKRRVEQVRRNGKPLWVTGKYGKFKGQHVKMFRVNVHEKWKIKVGSKISEVRKYPIAQIRRRGLAKRSWGWVMHQLFNQAAKSQGDDRRIYAKALRAKWTDDHQVVKCDIANALDYIRSAVPGGAVREAMAAATALITKKIELALERDAKKAKLK